jgi:anthranilate/para-aminobenzoate synthase component II
VFGGSVVRAPCGVMHGKTSLVYHDGTGLLQVRSPLDEVLAKFVMARAQSFVRAVVAASQQWDHPGEVTSLQHHAWVCISTGARAPNM